MHKVAGLYVVGFFLAIAASAIAQPRSVAVESSSWDVPSDDKIHQILVDRIDVAKQGVGLVVGVIDPMGRRIISYGALDQGDTRPLNGDTVFEIGSITKVFTSLILADMVQHGDVALDDPVAEYLPSRVRMPVRNGKQITLRNLSTHSSGLPRLPDNMKPMDPENPYADYTVDQMYQFLDGYTLPRDPGTQFEYSNLGGGLLGHALSLRAGMDYESLVRRRITGPLGMKDTTIALSPDMARRLAVGHDASLNPAANWDIPALAGAGALRSTTNDLLTFLAAELGIANTALKASMARQLSERRPTDATTPNMTIALGWLVQSDPRGTVIWHNGGTGGYRTFMGFNPATQTGVVVLSNANTPAGTDDIGQHLLTGRPLGNFQAPKTHTEIALDSRIKQAFVGEYQLAPNVVMAITFEGEQLFGQLTNQKKFEVFSESPTQVFFKIVDAQISFEMGADGRASRATLHQGGRDIQAKRIN